MANGTEQDIRDIRKDVQEIATKGCAHKETHDKAIADLWTALGGEQKARVGMFTRFVLLTLGIVLAGLISSYYATASAVEAGVGKALAIQAAAMRK